MKRYYDTPEGLACEQLIFLLAKTHREEILAALNARGAKMLTQVKLEDLPGLRLTLNNMAVGKPPLPPPRNPEVELIRFAHRVLGLLDTPHDTDADLVREIRRAAEAGGFK